MAKKGKTHAASKKRFRITRTGKILRRQSGRSHLLYKKSAKRKRRLGLLKSVAKEMEKKVRLGLNK
jgi:large subunit ribosomal protein L35